MSNPNPFVPQGSLLEQQSRRRSRLKLAVFCIVGIGAFSLVAMLIQGCKRDTSLDINPPEMADTNPPVIETNPPIIETNPVVVPPPINPSNTVVVPPPIVPQPQPTPQPPEPTTGETEYYTVVKGDTLGKIAKAHGISWKALEAANPGVNPRRLIPGKTKLVIPAAGATSSASPGETSPTDSGATIYVVKPGDTLHRIARKFGVSVKAIQRENHLTTTRINAGKKLKIPAKAETTPPPAPTDTTPMPPTTVAPPVSTIPATPEPAAPANN